MKFINVLGVITYVDDGEPIPSHATVEETARRIGCTIRQALDLAQAAGSKAKRGSSFLTRAQIEQVSRDWFMGQGRKLLEPEAPKRPSYRHY